MSRDSSINVTCSLRTPLSSSSVVSFLSLLCVIVAVSIASWLIADDRKPSQLDKTHPLSESDRQQLRRQFDEGIQDTNKTLESNPQHLPSLSKRGDWHFFRGDFQKALLDYRKMCEVDPTQEPGHWRLGLVMYYAGQYAESAQFFDRFFKTDDVDREGGLWKYLAQAKSDGPEKARAGLLKYTKPDRTAMLAVYRLFEGATAPDELLREVREAKLSDKEREQQLFYIELYIGLWLDAQGKPRDAVPHLRAATANQWPRTAGFGPHWMWQLARVHYELLAR